VRKQLRFTSTANGAVNCSLANTPRRIFIMQDNHIETLVVPIAAGAVCIAGAGSSGSELATGLRQLADRVEALSDEELRKHRAASVIHQYNDHYFIESDGRFITLCETGHAEKFTVVEIGSTIAQTKQALDKGDGDLGSGLVACDEWEIALGYAIGSARRCP
jgi:hypothetical protein